MVIPHSKFIITVCISSFLKTKAIIFTTALSFAHAEFIIKPFVSRIPHLGN